MEVGAVVAATPADHVRRETPAPGDKIIHVPKGVSVEIPLQSYFRLNAPGAGHLIHTAK